MTTTPLTINVWSDYVCPFCYLEVPVLNQLVETYKEKIRVVWRAFELRPDPVPTLDPQGDYLKTTWTQAVYPMARERNMILRLPPVQPRSRKAFEAAEFARQKNMFDPMHLALFRGFFEEGLDIGSVEVLLQIGDSVGLKVAELRAALDTGEFTNKVMSDHNLAYEIGINGVPAMLIGTSEDPLQASAAISGAQTFEHIQSVLEPFIR